MSLYCLATYLITWYQSLWTISTNSCFDNIVTIDIKLVIRIFLKSFLVIFYDLLVTVATYWRSVYFVDKCKFKMCFLVVKTYRTFCIIVLFIDRLKFVLNLVDIMKLNQDPNSVYYLHPLLSSSIKVHRRIKLVSVVYTGTNFVNRKRSMTIGLTVKNKMSFIDGT